MEPRSAFISADSHSEDFCSGFCWACSELCSNDSSKETRDVAGQQECSPVRQHCSLLPRYCQCSQKLVHPCCSLQAGIAGMCWHLSPGCSAEPWLHQITCPCHQPYFHNYTTNVSSFSHFSMRSCTPSLFFVFHIGTNKSEVPFPPCSPAFPQKTATFMNATVPGKGRSTAGTCQL